MRYRIPESPAPAGDLRQLADQFVRCVNKATLGPSQAALTEGSVGPHALVHQVLALAMTDQLLEEELDDAAGRTGPGNRETTLEDECGYELGRPTEDADGRLDGFRSAGHDAWAGSPSGGDRQDVARGREPRARNGSCPPDPPAPSALPAGPGRWISYGPCCRPWTSGWTRRRWSGSTPSGPVPAARRRMPTDGDGGPREFCVSVRAAPRTLEVTWT